MNKENLMPKGTNLDEIPNVKYLKGFPQQYRFNASQGVFNHKGETVLTKKGEPFTIVPVAFRKFRDDILGMGKKNWIEFFFLNNSNQVCSLLLHGYSVENLQMILVDLFYQDATLNNVALTIKPVEKQNKVHNSKYYIAEYSFEKLSESDVETLKEATKDLDIYRFDTLSETCEMQGKPINFTQHLQLCA